MNDLILLGAFMEGPQHGYVLKKLAGLLLGHDDMHNNLVYPCSADSSKTPGSRSARPTATLGLKRDLYALTAKGKLELVQRLARLTEKEVSSEDQFRVRVGLFSMLDRDTREHILDRFLARRQARFETIHADMAAMNADAWGYSVLRFYLSQVRAERKWITALKREAGERRKGKNRVVEL
jgi:hypothetical protein